MKRGNLLLIGTVLCGFATGALTVMGADVAKTRKENGEGDIEVVKAYIPAVFAGVSTIGLAYLLFENRKAGMSALMAASGCAISQRQTIEQQIKKILTRKDIDVPNEFEKVNHTVEKEKKDYVSIFGNSVIDTGHGDVLFFDSVTGQYFLSDWYNVLLAIYFTNKNFQLGMDVCINHWCDQLGIPQIGNVGFEQGWDAEYVYNEMENYWLDVFSHEEIHNGEKVQVLDWDLPPRDSEYVDSMVACCSAAKPCDI